MREDAPLRGHVAREIFSALRWVVPAGGRQADLPRELPVWTAIYWRARRRSDAGVFAAMARHISPYEA